MPPLAPHEIAHDAREIALEASYEEAGRVTFLADGKFVFAPVDEVVIASVLATHQPQRYKFQVQVDDRWVDHSKYKVIDASSSVLDALREGDLVTVAEAPTGALARAATTEPRVLATALRGLSRQLSDRLTADLASTITQPALRILDELAETCDDANVRYLHAAVSVLDSIAGAPMKDLIEDQDHYGALAGAMKRIEDSPELFATTEGQIAAANVLGKIHSMHSRELAAAQFDVLRELDTAGVVKHFYIDMGAYTYFAHDDLGDTVADDAAAVRASIELLDEKKTRNRAAVAMSMDPRFYRIYGPLVHFYAQQLPGVDYNIVLCGTADEVEAVREDSRRFVSALDQLNHSGASENIHFYRAPVPDFAVEPKTFYASARFFAAQVMLEQYQSVYVMDADLTTDVDPQPFFRRVASVSFGTPRSRGYTVFSPWRRYMAGNVPLNRGILETPVLDELQKYLAHGLRSGSSWMLDQNALAYVIERHPEAYTELNVYKRPFSAPKFRSVWEKNFLG